MIENIIVPADKRLLTSVPGQQVFLRAFEIFYLSVRWRNSPLPASAAADRRSADRPGPSSPAEYV